MARLDRGGKEQMYAVIKTGGKQYRVQEGDIITIEKLDALAGDVVEFDQVLVLNDDKALQVGTPIIEGVKVFGTVVENGKGSKVIIFKYKSKKDYRKKQGHRQPYTMVKIESLNGTKPVAKKPEVKAEEVPAESKSVEKKADKPAAEKKPAVKKATAEKKPATKKAAADKPAAKKPAAKKVAKTEEVKDAE